METGLHERDRAGVQDFVLLENYKSEEAFIENLKKRFQENLIYVSFLLTQNILNLPKLSFFQLLYRPTLARC